MRVSCLPVSFFHDIINGEMSLLDWAKTAKSVGLEGIDLSTLLLRNHTPTYLEQVNREFEEVGLPVVMVTAYPDFTHPDPQQRKREFEYFRRDIALTANLGAPYLRILAGQAHPETEIEQGIDWVVDAFSRMQSVARDLGVQLLFENHSKPGAWRYSDFSHPTDIFLRIVEATADSDIKINFDTGNTLVYGDDPLAVLEKIADRVVTVHAADTACRGKLQPVVVGTGIVPFDDIFKFLRQREFDGWICIEEASSTGTAGVRKAVDFVRDAWRRAG